MPEEIVAFETSKSEDEGYIDLSKKNDIEIIRVKKRKKKSAKPKKRAKPKKEEYDLLGGETKFSDIRLPNLKHLRLDELDDAAADDFTKIIKDFKRELNERVKEKERMLSEKLQTQIRKNNMALENAKINLEERYLRKYKREVAAKIREEKLLLAKRFEADYKQRVADFKDKNNMLLVDKKSKLRNSLNKELEDKSSKFQKKTEKIFSDKKRVLEKEVAIKTKNLDNDYKNKITQFKKGFADLRSELQQKDFELDEKELDVVSEMEAREAGLELLDQELEKDQENITLELNAQRYRMYGEQAKFKAQQELEKQRLAKEFEIKSKNLEKQIVTQRKDLEQFKKSLLNLESDIKAKNLAMEKIREETNIGHERLKSQMSAFEKERANFGIKVSALENDKGNLLNLESDIKAKNLAIEKTRREINLSHQNFNSQMYAFEKERADFGIKVAAKVAALKRDRKNFNKTLKEKVRDANDKFVKNFNSAVKKRYDRLVEGLFTRLKQKVEAEMKSDISSEMDMVKNSVKEELNLHCDNFMGIEKELKKAPPKKGGVKKEKKWFSFGKNS